MSTQEMKAALLARITGGGTTFVELEQVEGFGGGDRTLGMESRNIIFWDGVTDKGADALIQLEREGLIAPQPAPVFFYWHDGAQLNLPLANLKFKGRYKEPRWLPMVFNPAKEAN